MSIEIPVHAKLVRVDQKKKWEKKLRLKDQRQIQGLYSGEEAAGVNPQIFISLRALAFRSKSETIF